MIFTHTVGAGFCSNLCGWKFSEMILNSWHMLCALTQNLIIFTASNRVSFISLNELNLLKTTNPKEEEHVMKKLISLITMPIVQWLYYCFINRFQTIMLQDALLAWGFLSCQVRSFQPSSILPAVWPLPMDRTSTCAISSLTYLLGIMGMDVLCFPHRFFFLHMIQKYR